MAETGDNKRLFYSIVFVQLARGPAGHIIAVWTSEFYNT